MIKMLTQQVIPKSEKSVEFGAVNGSGDGSRIELVGGENFRGSETLTTISCGNVENVKMLLLNLDKNKGVALYVHKSTYNAIWSYMYIKVRITPYLKTVFKPSCRYSSIHPCFWRERDLYKYEYVCISTETQFLKIAFFQKLWMDGGIRTQIFTKIKPSFPMQDDN